MNRVLYPRTEYSQLTTVDDDMVALSATCTALRVSPVDIPSRTEPKTIYNNKEEPT